MIKGWIITLIIEFLIIYSFIDNGGANSQSIISIIIVCLLIALPILIATKEAIISEIHYRNIKKEDTNYKVSDVNSLQYEKVQTPINADNHLPHELKTNTIQAPPPEKGITYTKVVGVTMDDSGRSSLNSPRQLVIKELHNGDFLQLVHEPTNTFDSNALMVLTTTGKKIGYINKSINHHLVSQIKQGITFQVKIAGITGGGSLAYGVNIEIVPNEYIKQASPISPTRSTNGGGLVDFGDLYDFPIPDEPDYRDYESVEPRTYESDAYEPDYYDGNDSEF